MPGPAQRTSLPPWLRSMYPFRTAEVAIGAETMSYVDEGLRTPDAPVLMLIHGELTWSFVWRKVAPLAAERFHVIAPDLVGFGLSSKPSDPRYHSLDRHIENLTELVGSLGLEKVTLAGVGWGGVIALGYAVKRPESVSRVLAMNTWVWPWTTVQQTLRGRVLDWGLGTKSILALRGGVKALASQALEKAVLDGYAYPFAKSEDRAAREAFARIRVREEEALHQIAASLPSLRTRVEILWGERDPLLPGKVLPYLLRDSLGNVGEPKLLAKASHLVPEDDPGAVADRLLEVFKPKPAAPVFNILS